MNYAQARQNLVFRLSLLFRRVQPISIFVFASLYAAEPFR